MVAWAAKAVSVLLSHFFFDLYLYLLLHFNLDLCDAMSDVSNSDASDFGDYGQEYYEDEEEGDEDGWKDADDSESCCSYEPRVHMVSA